MLHLLGVILVLVGFIGGGIYFCDKEENKIKILTEWKRSLQILCNEIIVRQQPLLFALEETEKRLQGEVAIFYKKVNNEMKERKEELLEVWKKELKIYLKKSLLSTEGKKIIETLEEVLGYEDQKIQLGMLQTEIEIIENYRKEIEKEKKEKKKIILLLSICSGASLILLLI